jgi:hypothetical protein
MSTKKTLDISVEDLLKVLETAKQEPEDTTEPDTSDTIFNFLTAFNILPGKHSVSDNLLFKLFKLFDTQYTKSKQSFNIVVSQYLPKRLSGNRVFYLINNDMLQIGKTILNKIKSKKKDITKSKSAHKKFERFLSNNGLEPGTVYVEADILYYVYNCWCDKVRNQPISYLRFVHLCDLYFEKKSMSGYKYIPWYGLNENIKNCITEEIVENWRIGRAKKQGISTHKLHIKEGALYGKKNKT